MRYININFIIISDGVAGKQWTYAERKHKQFDKTESTSLGTQRDYIT